jgi:hypothetical protein
MQGDYKIYLSASANQFSDHLICLQPAGSQPILVLSSSLASYAILLIVINMNLVCDNGAGCSRHHNCEIERLAVDAGLTGRRIEWEGK